MIAQFCSNPNRLQMMIGASNFAYNNINDSFQLQFEMCRHANICIIRRCYRSEDTYIMEFRKTRIFGYKMIKIYEDLYCDQLTRIFEDFTGLYLSF